MRIGFNDYKEIKEYYDKGLNVDKKLVKTTNDEPTPITCVEEMVERIPEEFWKREGLKILDPCSGCGNFPFVIYYKLIKYHSRETILKDILHFNDLNMERIEVLKNIFDYEGLNVYTEDFLNFKTDIRFDLIVANPPYAKLDVNGKRTAKNHNLIGLFISKSLDLLLDKGLLLYITPDNWMSYADRNTLITRLTKLQIVHINIHTAKKYFPKVGSSFVWYLIENTPSYKDITVEGKWKGEIYKSSVKSEERRYIPLYYNKRVQSILRKTLDNKRLKKFEVETTSYLHKYTKKAYMEGRCSP